MNPRGLERGFEGPSEKVGSVTCFVVRYGYRKWGIAPRLLKSACDLIRVWGFPIAEGYPRNPVLRDANPYQIPEENLSFRGSLKMFLKSGFQVHRKMERMLVVRKEL